MADPADRDSSLAGPASRACPRGSVLISSGPRPAFNGNRNPPGRPRRFRPGRACHAVLRAPPRGGRQPRLDTRPRPRPHTRPRPRPHTRPRTSPRTSPRFRSRRHARLRLSLHTRSRCPARPWLRSRPRLRAKARLWALPKASPRARPPRRDMFPAATPGRPLGSASGPVPISRTTATPRTSVSLPNPRPPGPNTRTPRSARQCPTPPWNPVKDRPGKTGGATTTCPSGSARPASRSRLPLAWPPRPREPADARAAPRAIRRQPRQAGPRADQEPADQEPGPRADQEAGPPADQEAGPPADQEPGPPADREAGRGPRTPSCSTTGCPAAGAQLPAAAAAAP
jgi:hypothetical protein